MSFSINVPENAKVAYYKVKRAKCDEFVGWPTVRRETGTLYVDDGILHADRSLAAQENFTIDHWTTYHYSNSGASIDRFVPAGDVALVALYLDGSDWKVRGIAVTDRPMHALGGYTFDCSLAVTAGDIIGIWIKAGSNFQWWGDNFDTSPPTDVISFRYIATAPSVDQNLGASPLATYADYMFSITAIGTPGAYSYVTSGFDCSGSSGITNPVLDTDAFADGNVTNAANLFDGSGGTYAEVAAGDTGYVYCVVNNSAPGHAVEKIRLEAKQRGAGTVHVYTTDDAAGSVDLAGAEGINEGDWDLIAEIPGDYDDTTGDEAWNLHVGRDATWIRLKMVGITLSMRVYQLGFWETTTPISSNKFLATPYDGNWSRFVVATDLETGEITTAVDAADDEAELANVVDQGNFVEGDSAIVRHTDGSWVKMTIDDPAWDGDLLQFTEAVGDDYATGEFVDQHPAVFFLEAYDANDNLLGTGPLIGSWGNYDVRMTEHVDQ